MPKLINLTIGYRTDAFFETKKLELWQKANKFQHKEFKKKREDREGTKLVLSKRKK